jgi:hypothetical protein
MPATSPYLNLPLRDEPEVRRAKFKAALERNIAIGLAEGIPLSVIEESNRDMLRASDMAKAFGDLLRGLSGGIK